MQRSGGWAPVAVSAPRANSRTHAAAGEAVETTDPPRPKWGRVIARAVIPRPSAAATLTRCTETVSFDGDAASRAAAATSSAVARRLAARAASSSAGASDSRKLARLQPKLSPNVASSEWSV